MHEAQSVGAAVEHYDVVVVGGGLVGASALIALAAHPGASALRVAQIEANPAFATAAVSDERHLALNAFSWQTLLALGVALVPERCAPIQRVHISSQGDFGRVLLDAQQEGVPEFGRLVPASHLREALEARLSSVPLTLTRLSQTQLVALDQRAEHVVLTLQNGDATREIHASYVVGADGTESTVRTALERPASLAGAVDTNDAFDYHASALSFNLKPDYAHDGVAYERFTEHGPIALLPLPKGRMGVIWTLPSAAAAAMRSAPAAEFLAAFQAAFGYRLGRFSGLSACTLWPLRRFRAHPDAYARAVLIGNAAQTIHPLGAQGFNLGLRDALALAEVLANAQQAIDFAAFSAARAADRANTLRFSDSGLVATQSTAWLARMARSVAFTALDTAPLAKRTLTRFGLGFVR
jgi:2-octaprenyl-6-methoxyphenol hydroxylase